MKQWSRRAFLSSSGKLTVAGFIGIPFISGLLTGCESMNAITKVGVNIASSAGLISNTQGDAIVKTSSAVARSFEDITPEQEYYIGRTVGAMICGKYPPYRNSRVNRYINHLGQTLSRASDMPETYGGYHFLALNSDDINAFAAPGGFVFVTRGLLRCCETEDAAAAVLAHEIGHVQNKHGLRAIKSSRVTTALTTIGTQTARVLAGDELGKLTSVFEDSVSDIIGTMVNNGYSRKYEREADKAAVTIAERVGYNPAGLVSMLKIMDRRLKPGGTDFAKTHPSPKDRIAEVQKEFGSFPSMKVPKKRQKRFRAALGKI